MHPVLVDFGWFALPTYGVLMVAAFLAGLQLALRLGRRAGIDPEAIMNVWVALLLGGLVGAKLLLWVVELPHLLRDPRSFLSTLRSAGVYYGGFAGAALAGVVYARRAGLPVARLADVLAAPLALGQSVGRVGCFAAGCCFGRPTDLPWAVTFTHPRAAQIAGTPLHVPLHPTQAYLSLNALLLCGVLLLLWRRRWAAAWPDGVLIWVYLLLYSITRFILELFRGDERGGVAALSTSQIIAVAGFVAAMVALASLVRRHKARR